MDLDTKPTLRRSALAARRAVSAEERATAAGAMARHARRLPEVLRARTVLTYAALGDEADLGGLKPWLRERRVRVLLPRVRGEVLDLVAVTDLTRLEAGYAGILEPTGPRVEPSAVDVAFVPGVAFDRAGARLGRGGGHYDRLLASLPDGALRVGVALRCQVVLRVPTAPHDQPVDLLLTDHGVHRTGARDDAGPS